MLGVLLGRYGDLNGSCISLGPTQVYACTNSFSNPYQEKSKLNFVPGQHQGPKRARASIQGIVGQTSWCSVQIKMTWVGPITLNQNHYQG